MVRFTAAAVLASTIALVSAQSSAPSCVLPCYAQAISTSGSSCAATDLTCLCTDTKFQVATIQCFMASCGSAAAIQAAEALGIQSCAAAGINLNTAAIASSVAAATGGAATSGAASSGAATSSAAAMTTSAAAATTTTTMAAAATTTTAAAAKTTTASAAPATTTAAKASSANALVVSGSLLGAALVAVLAL